MSKVWFITGAGSGIGAGTAQAALKASDRVVATGRNVQKVRDALREVAGDDLYVLPLDVSDEAQVTMAVDQAVKKFGRIDVVLNSAGYSLLGNFEELGGSNPSVLAFVRQADGDGDTVLCVNNLSRFPQPIELNLQHWSACTPVELTGHVEFPRVGHLPYLLTLPGHGFYWFQLSPACEENA